MSTKETGSLEGKTHYQMRVVKFGGLSGEQLAIHEVMFKGHKPVSIALYEGRGAIEWEPHEDPLDKIVALLRALQMRVIDCEKEGITHGF